MIEGARFVRFLVTGGIAAAVNIGARWAFSLAVSYEVAVVLAFWVALTTGFLLTRRFVFPAAGGTAGGQFSRFALVNLVALVQVWMVSVGLVRLVFPAIGFVWQAETVGHVIGVLSPVATSYVLHRRFSFRPTGG